MNLLSVTVKTLPHYKFLKKWRHTTAYFPRLRCRIAQILSWNFMGKHWSFWRRTALLTALWAWQKLFQPHLMVLLNRWRLLCCHVVDSLIRPLRFGASRKYFLHLMQMHFLNFKISGCWILIINVLIYFRYKFCWCNVSNPVFMHCGSVVIK